MSARETMDSFCPVCGSEQVEAWVEGYDYNFGMTREKYSVMVCKGCGIGFTSPKPESVGEYYPDADKYWSSTVRQCHNLAEKRGIYYHIRRNQLSSIRRYLKNNFPVRLLDVGCGFGAFLKVAKDEGWSVSGIEQSEKYARIGSSLFGLDIKVEDFLLTDLEAESFDVITMFHVLEHLGDPPKTIDQAHFALKKGGLLVIVVPNRASLQAKFFRGKWFHLDLPRHLFHFTPKALTALVSNKGFRMVAIKSSSLLGSSFPLPNVGTIYGWWGSILITLSVAFQGDKGSIGIFRRVMTSKIGRISMWLFTLMGAVMAFFDNFIPARYQAELVIYAVKE